MFIYVVYTFLCCAEKFFCYEDYTLLTALNIVFLILGALLLVESIASINKDSSKSLIINVD